MPRRVTRRERLERQKEREEALEAGVPVRDADPAPRPDPEAGLSYTGASGGLLGAGLFFAIAVAVIVDPGDVSRLWAVPFVAGGVFFVPAIIASLNRGYPRRERVLRVATIGSMLIAFAGSLLTGSIAFAALLAPATALLAISAGLIFQGGGAKK